MQSTQPIRVLLGKPGLDGHNRGVHVIARSLRDAGLEVVYLGIRKSPEEIARAAIDEDVDVIGVSILSGAHLALVQKLVNELERCRGMRPIVVGGIIPDEDVEPLREMGVASVLGPGSSLRDVVEAVSSAARPSVSLARGEGTSAVV